RCVLRPAADHRPPPPSPPRRSSDLRPAPTCTSRCGKTAGWSTRASSWATTPAPRWRAAAAAEPGPRPQGPPPGGGPFRLRRRRHRPTNGRLSSANCVPSYNEQLPPAGAPLRRHGAPGARGVHSQLAFSMINKLLTRVFGSRNERLLRQLDRIVARINALEPEMQKLSDDQLKAKTPEFQQRIANGEPLDKILPEAFAVCREASSRVLGMRHYDVQMIGGMVLHMGKIAEMRTGEGKTLVATLPVYLNALEGKGVHVVTVNDYLARRDAAWMGRLYNWLGLSVGVVYPGMPHSDKKAAYAADITYGTNNEFGFDYLRDNMALSKQDRFQRGLHYAIVDEVDSILIDEARTPLIISGPADESPELYIRVDKIVPHLVRQQEEEGEGDFWVDEKGKQVYLSETGQEKAEALLREAGILEGEDSLYASHNIHVVHHLTAALRAHAIYQRDVDYIVRDGEVVIVDEFTGRTLPGRRWSDGL